MTNTRRDLARLTYAADKDIDTLFAPLSEQIGTIVRLRAVDGKITQESRVLAQKDIDTLLDQVFPKRRGAPSRLQALIEARASQAAELPVRDAVAVMRRHVPSDLLEAMGDK